MKNNNWILIHPYFLASLVVLLLNDFYLKWHYPGIITGKLSDFAGLFIFASFACILVGRYINSNRFLLLLHFIIGLAFSVWELLPIDECFNFIYYDWQLPKPVNTSDISDLVALTVLPLNAIFIKRKPLHGKLYFFNRILAKAVTAAVCIATATAIMATSVMPPSIYRVDESIDSRLSNKAELLYKVEETLNDQGFIIVNKRVYFDGFVIDIKFDSKLLPELIGEPRPEKRSRFRGTIVIATPEYEKYFSVESIEIRYYERMIGGNLAEIIETRIVEPLKNGL